MARRTHTTWHPLLLVLVLGVAAHAGDSCSLACPVAPLPSSSSPLSSSNAARLLNASAFYAPSAVHTMWSTAAFVGNATLRYLNATRGAGDTWYANSLANFLVFLCVEMADVDRCVASTSAYAAKNASSGACLRLADAGNCFDRNLCERRESCKWPLLTEAIAVRVPLFTDEDAAVATQWVRTSYPKTLFLYTVPGLLVAAVLVLATWIFCVMRFSCNRCWGYTPSRRGYTWLERWGPIVIFLWTTCFLIACAAIVLAQGVAFQDAVRSIAGSTNATMTQLAAVPTDAIVPLETLQKTLSNVSMSDVRMALAPATPPGNWTSVVSSMEVFTSTYEAVGDYPLYACSRSAGATLAPTTTSCTACPEVVCGAINGTLQRILDDTAPLAWTPPLATLLEPTVNASPSSLDLERLMVPLDSIQSLAAAYYTSTYPHLLWGFGALESLSLGALQAALGLGLVSSALGLLGIFAGLASNSSRLVHLLHGSWMLGVVFSFLGLVLGTYCLVLAVLGLDLCTYVSLVKSHPDRYLPSAGATIATQCLGELTHETAFPELRPLAQWTCEGHAILDTFAHTNLSQPLAAAEAYSTRLQSFSPSTFGYATSELLRRIAALAVATTKATWTPTRLLTPWQVYGSAFDPTPCTLLQSPDAIPLCFMALKCHGANTTCYSSFERAYSLKRLEVEATALLANMTLTYASGPKASYAAYAAATTSSRGAHVHLIATNSSLGASLAASRALVCAPSLRCATFQNQAATLEAGLCHSTLEFLALCSALLFAASVIHLAQVLAAILLQKRLRGTDFYETARRKQRAAVAIATRVDDNTSK
ncbi:hypothetical protein SPRG_10354 [Saprolegnia parasitica CBS 223.65]|uniref:Uncharacterized protein n=1 Tax=Saprolegnia parasitica (strain CBS 223.65) TaxID=695850 RepID=A0A067C177_SAPPC|nr:hypothetical protein SPRG_10354 [Saprolegnia parasitica CBS 223.65]KDO24539.1 hypothetical protein SPRG_10354 [Saprolegnia parasitica CBS 223.65]|eukprot:XP_012204800.1 hypothetical protein SPRG_10354 [Saprolegnia parasitica CBS 223.65]